MSHLSLGPANSIFTVFLGLGLESEGLGSYPYFVLISPMAVDNSLCLHFSVCACVYLIHREEEVEFQ